MASDEYQPIGNYGIIGNLHTVALVSLLGSIDFMCFTRFDSPTIFASLLDAKQGGFFSISPELGDVDTKQMYLPDTAVLLTRFLADEGVAEMTDFMPVKTEEENCVLVRSLVATRGKIPFRLRCQPRFNYARARHTAKGTKHEVTFTSEDDSAVSFRLISTVPLVIEGQDVYAEFTIEEKEQAHFVIESYPEGQRQTIDDALQRYTRHDFDKTVNFWKSWIGKSKYNGRWREMVDRSAITLKLLTSCEFGSMVAAPTFSLPSIIGGHRNWDYRYTWIRDSAFAMYAFIRLGFMDEAAAFMNWIGKEMEAIDQHQATLQLMYTIDGDEEVKEVILKNLEGYKKSQPVRIGNAAYTQFQLDIFGELMDSIYLYNKFHGAITYDFWQKVERQIEFVCNNWQRPDHGIWEVRGEECEFLESRLMCWVALDRAIKVVEDRSFPSPIERWRQTRDLIYHTIYHEFWSEEKQSFVQHTGSDTLDASALLMPLVRFIHPKEPRWLATLAAIERELVSDSLVYRYRLDSGATDGLDGEEGTFSMCSFWYIECLSRSGQVEKARLLFDKMLGYANHLGLFAEQLGRRGQQLGNFPQAFTHLGLISAAHDLERRLNNFEEL